MKYAIAFILAGLFTISGMMAGSPMADDGAGLVTSKCVACHSLKRVCRNLGKKDLTAWEKTNARMVKMGMEASDEEVALITNYLANAKPGDKAICK